MILSELSDPALARASKQNLIDFFHFLRRSPSVHFFESEGCTRWLTQVPHPWFNGIALGRPPRAGDSAFLDAASRHFAQHGVARFTCWIDTHVETGLWHPLLTDEGFLYDEGAPGMAMDLAAAESPSLPAGFRMERVATRDDLAAWCRTFIEGYELPPEWSQDFYRLMDGLGLSTPVAHYLGYLEEKPVVTSSLYYGAGVAGIQFVSTIPEARRQGLGGIATLFPLADARARGYKAAILQSSQMGFSVYKRIGFRKVSDVDNYCAESTRSS